MAASKKMIYYETSAKTGQNIDEAFMKISNTFIDRTLNPNF